MGKRLQAMNKVLQSFINFFSRRKEPKGLNLGPQDTVSKPPIPDTIASSGTNPQNPSSIYQKLPTKNTTEGDQRLQTIPDFLGPQASPPATSSPVVFGPQAYPPATSSPVVFGPQAYPPATSKPVLGPQAPKPVLGPQAPMPPVLGPQASPPPQNISSTSTHPGATAVDYRLPTPEEMAEISRKLTKTMVDAPKTKENATDKSEKPPIFYDTLTKNNSGEGDQPNPGEIVYTRLPGDGTDDPKSNGSKP